MDHETFHQHHVLSALGQDVHTYVGHYEGRGQASNFGVTLVRYFIVGWKITGGQGVEGKTGALSYVRYFSTGLWTSTDEVSVVIVALCGKCCPIFEDNVTYCVTG